MTSTPDATPTKKVTTGKADATTTPAAMDAAPVKATRTRKATTDTIAVAAQADTKPEFAPTVTATGRLDHSTCGHARTLAGRQACRDAQKAAQA